MDNGVYNKFVRQSTNGENDDDEEGGADGDGKKNNSGEGLLSHENSLIRSMNKDKNGEGGCGSGPVVS